MDYLRPVLYCAATLLLIRSAAYLSLSWLNTRHVRENSNSLPDAFKGIMSPERYAKAVRYTLESEKLDRSGHIYRSLVLAVVLFSGLLPWFFSVITSSLGHSVWVMSAFVFAVSALLSICYLPLDWWEQFRLEERFGFNTTTQRTWWSDRIKGFLIAALIGFPLLLLILKLVDWTGEWWWFWAAASLVIFQFLMLVLSPVIIMPLFNKFEPLPDGELRDRLLALARQTGFQTRGVEVMDGSRRSRHSNAFFTGFGRFRKIVLFDTLIEQLSENELEAVLAHEIGHYRRRHILKLILASVIGVFAGFAILGWLAKQEWLYGGFGFREHNPAIALLLFGLMAGVVAFWMAPAINVISRRFEYEADAFAARAVNSGQPLITALRKMYEKNLENLTPHPLYSGFHYSHPTLVERENALRTANPREVEAGAAYR